MSLLMDALKKAEREKNRAASKKNADEVSDSVEASDQTSKVADQARPAQSTKEVTQNTTAEQKDENWAFETSELELEPLAQKQEITDDKDSLSKKASELEDDTTIIEPIPPSSITIEDDLTVKSDPEIHKSDFDHDATLPSERAIQSSLKDYFEASQSITMDQSSVSGSVSPDITEHSVTSTSPLDASSTHVTAHTIFTAGQSRQASTGLAKYALFGTLFLSLGLGAVALYYSYVTPTAIDIPESQPIVARMVESDEQLQTVEVDVNTAETAPPFEPGTELNTELEDPVLAEVVEEISPAESEQPAQIEVIEEEAQVVNVVPSPKLTQETLVVEKPAASETVSSSVNDRTVANKSFKPESLEHKVVYFPQTEAVAKQEPEEAIILNDQQYQAATLQGGYTLDDQIFVSDQSSSQPIDVVSADDFAEGLNMPKSAIKITRGRTHRASNSDLSVAYQAYQAGDFLNAKAAYRKVLNRRPDSRDARLGIAAIAVMEGNYETAYRHYQYLLQQNPKDQLVNAALFNLQGNASGAVNESQLKLLLDQNPDSAQVHFSLGSFYASQARWPDAQQAFFEAYSAEKHNADYAYNLAVSLDQMGQVKSALSYYRIALKLSDQAPVSFNTSRVLARIQKLSGITKK